MVKDSAGIFICILYSNSDIFVDRSGIQAGWTGYSCTGKVKYYNIVMSIALLMNIIFSFIFLSLGFLPAVVLVINVCVGILCFAIRLLFARHYKVLIIHEYIRNVIFRTICISALVVQYLCTSADAILNGLVCSSPLRYFCACLQLRYIL